MERMLGAATVWNTPSDAGAAFPPRTTRASPDKKIPGRCRPGCGESGLQLVVQL